jgi:CRISPR-associated endonuclease/helicase Cas3
MSATVPAERRLALIRCGLKPPQSERPADLQAIADAKRYRIRRVGAPEVPERVRVALRQNKRVLWVVNQVKRAQQTSLLMREGWPDVASWFCYHSRFMLADRRDRHKEVVEAFQRPGVVALGITTQVCEMSLDLDADLLVTEECPITSLIQRIGRCHRNRVLREGAGEILVYRPDDEKPYDREQLGGLEGFLNDLCSDSDENTVSQTMLEAALEVHGPKLGVPDRWCAFVNSGPYAQGGDETFRDIDEFTVPAVLASKVPAFVALQKNRLPTAGIILPVPRRRGMKHDTRLPKYLAVAPDDHYEPRTGFWDTPVPPGALLP